MAKNSQQTDYDTLFEEFLSMFDAFEEESSDVASEELSELEQYLSKEDRLSTLAREKYSRMTKQIELSSAEEKLYSYVPKKEEHLADIVQKISKTFTRPLLKSMESVDDEYAAMLFSLVNIPTIRVVVSMEVPSDIEFRLSVRLREAYSKTDGMLCVTVYEDGYMPFTVYGMKGVSHPSNSKCICYQDGVNLADIADLFSHLIVYAQVMRTISSFKEEGATESALYHAYMEEINAVRYQFARYACNIYPLERREDYRDASYEQVMKLPIYYPAHALGPYFDKVFEEHPELNRLSVREEELSQMLGKELDAYISIHTVYWHQFPFCYMLDMPVPYNELLNKRGSHVWVLPPSTSCKKRNRTDAWGLKLIADLYRLLAEEKNDLRESYMYLRELDNTYAKSFMSKKNNNGKVLNAMKNSLFNNYFGFVEFDEDTDLQKAEEISKEFMALKETYLKGVDSSDKVIRFRKLGNHKALGLYYPSVGCLCVDIRSPKSLVHEYGHLIDFSNGLISQSYEFSIIRRRYRMALENAMNTNDSFKKAMSSNTKYNLSYYLKPIEIFARSFELYIAKGKGVKNSIVPQEFNECVYPQDAYYMELVNKYFDGLLERLNNAPFPASNKSQLAAKAAAEGGFK